MSGQLRFYIKDTEAKEIKLKYFNVINSYDANQNGTRFLLKIKSDIGYVAKNVKIYFKGYSDIIVRIKYANYTEYSPTAYKTDFWNNSSNAVIAIGDVNSEGTEILVEYMKMARKTANSNVYIQADYDSIEQVTTS